MRKSCRANALTVRDVRVGSIVSALQSLTHQSEVGGDATTFVQEMLQPSPYLCTTSSSPSAPHSRSNVPSGRTPPRSCVVSVPSTGTRVATEIPVSLQFVQSVRDTILAHEKSLLESLKTIVAQEIFIRIGRIAVIQSVSEGPDVALDSISKSRDGTLNVNSAGKSLLRCSKGRVSVFFASAAQYIEVDASNGKFACWNVAFLQSLAKERRKRKNRGPPSRLNDSGAEMCATKDTLMAQD